MKRPVILCAALCLTAGLLLGGILPMPWDRPAVVTVTSETIIHAPDSSQPQGPSALTAPEPLNSKDNFPLLNTACAVVRALEEEDYATLAAFVHPERGVTFTPYSTVDFEVDHKFTRDQIKALAGDKTVYTWGVVDGRGSLIELTMEQYFARYVFDADYTQAPQIGVDQILMSGNALENLTEAYPGCRFVDFCFPGLDPSYEGMDWRSLKLVFAPGEVSWLLVGIVHGEWTI